MTDFVFAQLVPLDQLQKLPEALYVTGSGNEFSHVLFNILNNAKEALAEKGIPALRIHIRLFREGEKKVVTVRENAGGVPESDSISSRSSSKNVCRIQSAFAIPETGSNSASSSESW